jgi:hypothetical protein
LFEALTEPARWADTAAKAGVFDGMAMLNRNPAVNRKKQPELKSCRAKIARDGRYQSKG